MGCCNYKISFKGSDATFPGWNVEAGDNLVWSVLPSGGTLPSGIALGINYVYTPRCRSAARPYSRLKHVPV